MVIGIEGKWGSGKTSLINLVFSEFENRSEDQVHVVNFSPWLVPEKSDYVAAFMNELAVFLEDLPAPDADTTSNETEQRFKRFRNRKTRTLADNARRYGAKASRGAASLLGFAGYFGLSLEKWEKLAKQMGNSLDSMDFSLSLEDLKKSVSDGLRRSGRRFIVFIDDMDRLEPEQAVEVIRLVRSVADFPNTVYVICYDKEILTNAIEQGLKVPDGHAYLQKIIQVSFRVPRPEAFDLREWLLEELLVLFEAENENSPERSEYDDIQEAVSTVGSLMQTPRDVKMVLNSIRFHYPPVRDKIYYPDLCWLHLRRVLDPDLYSWIERYIPEWAVIAPGDARATSDDVRGFGDEINKLLTSEGVDSLRSVWSLMSHIPGLDTQSENSNGAAERTVRVFQNVSQNEIHALESGKRLASPSHYRYYFSFSSSRTSMHDGEFNSLLEMAENDASAFRAKLVELSQSSRPSGGSWLDYFIDRVARSRLDGWPKERLENFVFALADSIDVACQAGRLRQTMNRIHVYSVASDLVYLAMSALEGEDRAHMLEKVFGEASSIGWIVEELLQKEALRHSKYGGEKAELREQVLSDQELARAVELVLGRLETKTDRDRLVDAPELGSALFRWRDISGGDLEPPRKWIDEYTQSDREFLDIMEKLRGWSSSTNGISYPLNRREVSLLAEWKDVVKRLTALADHADHDISEKARELLSAIRENS